MCCGPPGTGAVSLTGAFTAAAALTSALTGSFSVSGGGVAVLRRSA